MQNVYGSSSRGTDLTCMLFRFMPLPYVNTTTGAEPSPDAAAAAPYRGPTIILRPGQKLMDGAAIGALQSVAPLWCETHFKVSKSSVRPLAPTATSSTSPFGSASEFAAKRLPSDALDHTMVPRGGAAGEDLAATPPPSSSSSETTSTANLIAKRERSESPRRGSRSTPPSIGRLLYGMRAHACACICMWSPLAAKCIYIWH